MTLAGGNHITLSQNGNAVTISAFNESQSFGMSNVGNTAGTSGMASAANIQFVLAGGSNITLSQSLNVGSGGGTISIIGKSAATDGTISMLVPTLNGASSFRQLGQSTVKIVPFVLPNFGSFTAADLFGTVSMVTNATGSQSGSLSLNVGVYTYSASSLMLVTSGSSLFAWTDLAGVSSVSLTGERRFIVPMNFTGTPGNYWYGVMSATAFSGSDEIRMSNMGVQISPNRCDKFGTLTAATHQFLPYAGEYTAQTAAMPGTIANSEIYGSNSATLAPLIAFRNLQ